MALASELEALSSWLDDFPRKAMPVVGASGAPMCVLDFIVLGAVKRSLSLASGLIVLIKAKNMVCARAVLRMHLDTITRLSAYLYVEDPEQLAKAVLGGKALNTFKSKDGRPLRDGYLVDRLSERFPWVRNVYDFTSGYVHFSERQFFDAVHSVGNDEERTVRLSIGRTDDKYPEFSWEELPACFNHLNAIFEEFMAEYVAWKRKRYPVSPPDLRESRANR
jgi:hypothetical protein